MPNRPFIPYREPPSTMDRYNAHPWDVLVALYGIVAGLARIYDGYLPSIPLTTGTIPHLPASLLSIGWVIGGVIWIYAIFRHFETMNRYYFVLRTSLTILGISWLGYFVAAVILKPYTISIWFLALMATVGVWGLWYQSFHNEQATRKGDCEL